MYCKKVDDCPFVLSLLILCLLTYVTSGIIREHISPVALHGFFETPVEFNMLKSEIGILYFFSCAIQTCCDLEIDIFLADDFATRPLLHGG